MAKKTSENDALETSTVATATVATGASLYVTLGPSNLPQRGATKDDEMSRSFTNIQLAFWLDAKARYSTYVHAAGSPDLSQMIIVTVALLNSLTFLFGRNYAGKSPKTPELPQMIKMRGLEKARPDIYRDFKTMFTLYRNVIKHPDESKIEQLAKELTKAKLTEFYETTRKTWIWFINDFYARRKTTTPPGQLKEFV